MASTDAKVVVVKNTATRLYFAILDADGDLVTGATGLDSEISKDGGTFADCTNEATEIATNSGCYYLDVTSSEANCDCFVIIVKTSTVGAKTTVLVVYTAARGFNDLAFPTTSGRSIDVAATGEVGLDFSNVNGTLDAAETTGLALTTDITALRALLVARTNTAQAGAASTITLDAGAVATDNYYVGCMVLLTSGTGAGQVRLITSYVGATKVATVAEAWATNPDNTSVFSLLPNRSMVSKILTDVVDAAALKADAVTEIQSGLGTATAQLAIASAIAAVQADTDDIQSRIPAALAGGRMDSSIGAAAANTLTASALAADAVTEIAAGVLAATLTELTAVPGAAPSLAAAIEFLYMAIRNQATDTASAATIRKDDGTVIGSAVLSDDGTTFTKGKYS